MNVNTAQTAFSGGELSPLIMGRHDIEKFGVSGEIVENFMPLSQGPLVRRPGTEHVAESGYVFRTICFNYSKDVFYIVQIHKNIPGYGIVVYNQAGIRVAFGIPSPYTEAELFDISYAQSADVLFLTHPNHPPARLSRYGETDWRFDYVPIVNGPFQDITPESDSGVVLNVSTIVDSTILSFMSDSGGANLVADFNPTDYIAFNKNGQEVLGIVNSVNTSNNTVTVASLEDSCFHLPKAVFSPGVYSGWDSTNGIPKYRPFFIPTGADFPVFGTVGAVTVYIDYTWRCEADLPQGKPLILHVVIRQPPSEEPRKPTRDDAQRTLGSGYVVIGVANQILISSSTVFVETSDATEELMFPDAVYSVAFSNTQVVTRDMVHNYLSFSDESGRSYWGAVAGVGNILEQGAYGIIGRIRFLPVKKPPEGVNVVVGQRNITATITSNVPVFDPIRDVGRSIRLFVNDSVLHAKIIEDVSQLTPTLCRVSLDTPPVMEDTPNQSTVATTDWSFGAWWRGNYPSCVCFFEQRLVFAASNTEPQSIWMSRTGSFYDFAPTENDGKVLDDNAISLTLASTNMNRIKWLQPKQTLVVGTLGSEWIVQAGTSTVALTPTNVTVRNHSSYGSDLGMSHGLSRSTIYVQRGGEKLRDMSYDYYNDIYVSLDLTVFSEHILRNGGGAIYHDYLGDPNPMIFTLLKDGTLAVLNYEPDQKVYSWSRWIFYGKIRSLACVDSAERTGVYMCIEYDDHFHTQYLDLSEKARVSVSNQMDGRVYRTNGFIWNSSRERYRAILTQTHHNIIYVDGVPVEDAIFERGEGSEGSRYMHVTLPERFTRNDPVMTNKPFVTGVRYTSTYKSYPMNIQIQTGNIQGKKKRLTGLGVRFKDTVYGKVSRIIPKWPQALGGYLIEEEDLSKRPDVQFSPTSPASFDYHTPVPNGFDTRGQFMIVQDRPFPMTILALYPETSFTTE